MELRINRVRINRSRPVIKTLQTLPRPKHRLWAVKKNQKSKGLDHVTSHLAVKVCLHVTDFNPFIDAPFNGLFYY